MEFTFKQKLILNGSNNHVAWISVYNNDKKLLALVMYYKYIKEGLIYYVLSNKVFCMTQYYSIV